MYIIYIDFYVKIILFLVSDFVICIFFIIYKYFLKIYGYIVSKVYYVSYLRKSIF